MEFLDFPMKFEVVTDQQHQKPAAEQAKDQPKPPAQEQNPPEYLVVRGRKYRLVPEK